MEQYNMTIKSNAQNKIGAAKKAKGAVTYKTKAGAVKAAKRFGTVNFAVLPAYADTSRFMFVDTTKQIERAEQSTAKPIPMAWRFFDANYKTMKRAAMIKALIKGGANENMAKSQAYRFFKWLDGKWPRPVTCPLA